MVLHVSRVARELRRHVRLAPGCYWIVPAGRELPWPTSNEFPASTSWLRSCRPQSGRALDVGAGQDQIQSRRWIGSIRLWWTMDPDLSGSMTRCDLFV
jgi:hypothetical protein